MIKFKYWGSHKPRKMNKQYIGSVTGYYILYVVIRGASVITWRLSYCYVNVGPLTWPCQLIFSEISIP